MVECGTGDSVAYAQTLKPGTLESAGFTVHVVFSSGSVQQCRRHVCRPLREACWRHGTGWVKAPKVVQERNTQNLLCQLNSLQEVGDLWLRHSAAHRLRYTSVIFLRPDVLYTDPLPVEAITNVTVRPCLLPTKARGRISATGVLMHGVGIGTRVQRGLIAGEHTQITISWMWCTRSGGRMCNACGGWCQRLSQPH